MKIGFVSLLAATLGLCGCGLTDNKCNLNAPFGLFVTVHDARTQSKISVLPVVTFTNGVAIETANTAEGLTYYGADHPGTYNIQVKATAYQDYNNNNVVVNGNACGQAVAVHLTADLRPATP